MGLTSLAIHGGVKKVPFFIRVKEDTTGMFLMSVVLCVRGRRIHLTVDF